MTELYKMLINIRENDAKRFWTIFSLLSIINAGLLAVLYAKDSITSLRIITPALGFVLCIIWILAQRSIGGWFRWWGDKIREIEPYFLEEINLQRKNANLGEFKKYILIDHIPKNNSFKNFTISTVTTGWLVPTIFAVLWLILLFLALKQYF
jgi:hypothetical protein